MKKKIKLKTNEWKDLPFAISKKNCPYRFFAPITRRKIGIFD
jgi:hypothetical protein